MLSKWIDDLKQPIEKLEDAVAFAIFVFERIGKVRQSCSYEDAEILCKLYLEWRDAVEGILRKSNAAMQVVESQYILQRMYNHIENTRLDELVALIAETCHKHNKWRNVLLDELNTERKRIHA